MPLNEKIAEILAPAYGPCPGFSGSCQDMCWDPESGHVPRGLKGACGRLDEIELVLVFAEPGDPYPGEAHPNIAETYVNTCGENIGPDQFHRNVKFILDSCWDIPYRDQLRKVWMTESVLCSAPRECGPIQSDVWRACGTRYLLPQLELLDHALVVALGAKARDRLRGLGVTDFLHARHPAPPGCNRAGARSSWRRISGELERLRGR